MSDIDKWLSIVIVCTKYGEIVYCGDTQNLCHVLFEPAFIFCSNFCFREYFND